MLKRYLIESSLWTSGGIAALVAFCAHILDVEPTISVLTLALGVPLLVLNFDHILDLRLEEGRKQAGGANQPAFWFGLALAITLVTYGLLRSTSHERWVCFGVLLLGLAYGLPLPGIAKGQTPRRPKSIPGIKAWYVTLLITAFCVLLVYPWALSQPPPSLGVLVLFLLIFVSTNAHMFDVRDLEEDGISGTVTLPGLIGLMRTKFLLVALNLLALLVVLAWSWPQVELGFLAGLAASLVFVAQLNPLSDRLRYAIQVDGTLFVPILVSRLVS